MRGQPPSGVADVPVSWVDEQGVARQGRIRLAASGLPVGWAVELLAAGATSTGMTVATGQVEIAQAPQVVTRPAGERSARGDGRVQLRTINERGHQ